MLYLGTSRLSDCKNYLEGRLKSVQQLLDEEENRLTSTSSPLQLCYCAENINVILRKTTLTSGGFNLKHEPTRSAC